MAKSKAMMDITVVIVSYMRADLIARAYKSIRIFHPDMKIVIVDGSPLDSECRKAVELLAKGDPNVDALYSRKNIGHGPGMDTGIKWAKTKYVLLMDSDAELIDKDVIRLLYGEVYGLVFGCGLVVNVDSNGTNVPDEHPEKIPYLHPYFAMINREIYMSIPGFVHHGAPCLRTMEYLKTFKKFRLANAPGLENFVKHEGRGTRSLNPPEFLKGWK